MAVLNKYKKIINVSSKYENYSQRNNLIKPMERCQITSIVMATSYIPSLWNTFISSRLFIKYHEKYSQEEDCLSAYFDDLGLDPEVHANLELGYNNFMNGGTRDELGIKYIEYDKFSTKVEISDLIDRLRLGIPSVISGTFPGYPTNRKSIGKQPLGHVVTLVGCAWSNNSHLYNHPDYMIIDDPYGNTLNDWKGSGNDIYLSWTQFMSWMKPISDKDYKWAHTFNMI